MPRGECSVRTTGRAEMVDLTDRLQQAMTTTGVEDGVLVVYNPHGTAAITISEGAAPDVQHALLEALQQIVPASDTYHHTADNSLALLLRALTGSSVTILFEGGQLRLGPWQRVFFCEFDGPRDRKVWWTLLPS